MSEWFDSHADSTSRNPSAAKDDEIRPLVRVASSAQWWMVDLLEARS
jgi:hypothetical protein